MAEIQPIQSQTDGSSVGSRRWIRVLLCVLALLGLLVVVRRVCLAALRPGTRPSHTKIRRAFKYGSTGGERESGFPYWIFQAMPQVCAQHLPGRGYASLGFVYEGARTCRSACRSATTRASTARS